MVRLEMKAFLAVLFFLPVLTANGAQDRTVSILYAGSLAAVMERGVGPAFSKATGFAYQGEAQGSVGAAQMIHDHLRTPDVFISADPLVNVNILMGPGNENLVKWFTVVSSSQLVLAYNPQSKFAEKFKEVEAGKTSWYELLESGKVRFGRGDPAIDPKGYRTLFLFDLASKHYGRPEIPKLLGELGHVFPEVTLMAQVESGQLDAGIFYKHELYGHKLQVITLPPEINLADPRFAGKYHEAVYTLPSGQQVHGAPILFTVTIPETVRHREAALAFVRFLLGSNELLKQFGFGNVEHQTGGDSTQVPSELRGLNSGSFTP
jgi:molybdate/tungstate transport system substrate-binding protein